MEVFQSIFTYIIDAGSFIFVPIIIIVLGLIVGIKLAKAFRAGLSVGMGLAGIDLVMWSLLFPTFNTPATLMIERFGLKNLEYLDVGWGLPAAIGWSTPLVPIVVLIVFLVNILLIVLKLTKTLDIDFWNYWHMSLLAAYVFFITNNLVLALILAVVYFIILLKAADFFAPMVQKYWGYPGVSIPHAEVISMGIIQYPVNWLIEKIPFLNKINADQESIRKKFGIFGEVPVMGFIIGVLLALLGGMEIRQILLTGVKVALGFYLMPKMISILVEGLLPIAEGARDFVTKKFKDREIYLGLDAAVLMGDSTVLATGLLLLPFFILVSAVLPGNKVLPIGTLDATIWYVAIAVGLSKGNMVKAIINGIITLPVILWVSTAMAPLLTKVAIAIQYELPEFTEGVLGVTGVTTGAEWPAWLLTLVAKLFA